MIRFGVFLRAVNVGGTGKLPMADLRAFCGDAGFTDVQTYIASGNVALTSDQDAATVKTKLEAQLLAYAGKPVSVFVRDAVALRAIIAENPFQGAPGRNVIVMLSDVSPEKDDLVAPKGVRDEVLEMGQYALYVYFPSGQGASRLQVPGSGQGTARNMNTIAKMAALVSG